MPGMTPLLATAALAAVTASCATPAPADLPSPADKVVQAANGAIPVANADGRKLFNRQSDRTEIVR